MSTLLPRYVEIETSRLCNRHCAWCPNGRFEDRGVQELMEWDLFVKIVRELKGVGFNGWLAFHNYNEPLLNPRLIDELSHARYELPECALSIFSNGDYLTHDLLDRLAAAGLNYLRITLYPTRHEAPSSMLAAGRLAKWSRAKGLADWLAGTDVAPSRQGYSAKGAYKATAVEIIVPDLGTYNWRGNTSQLMTVGPRTTPCEMTSHSASIDYRGRLKMCCNVFPEYEAHSPFVVGDLHHSEFRELWLAEAFERWRKEHARSDWSHSSICTHCTQQLPARQTTNVTCEDNRGR